MGRLTTMLVYQVCFALGDPIRFEIIRKLTKQGPENMTKLGEGIKVTRQAVAQHVSVLENARLVRREKVGREVIVSVEPATLEALSKHLASMIPTKG